MGLPETALSPAPLDEFQRCAGRRVGPRNGLVLLLIKKIFFASGGAAQAAGPLLKFLSVSVPDLRITPLAPGPASGCFVTFEREQTWRFAKKARVRDATNR